MPTFRIVVAYDGTDFVGWQRQSAGTSIQGLLEDALTALDERPVAVAGAGRTDAGVHALGQVASFTLARRVSAATIVNAVNARLPPAIRVLNACETPPSFHARFAARAKTYRYRIWNAAVLSPFERRYAWHLSNALDVERMADAAGLLEGRHNFAGFQSAGSNVPTTVRTVSASGIIERGPGLVTYEITGDGFLRHMVRSIVGTLVEIGRGRWAPSRVEQILSSGDRTRAGPTAPPEGLFLVSVEYGAL